MFSRIQPISNSNNPRKRQKRAHSSDSEEAAPSHTPPPTMPFAPSLPHAKTGGEQQICLHEQTLKRLEPDLDAMRQLITCKICQRFLSEPYGLACGHTYCYVCLDAWVVSQKKRTCPDCRASIKQEPIPSFLIREMTRVFAYREELLPDGETVKEHDECIREAAAKVAADKESGGLFRGIFGTARERMRWMPLHDPGDDVERCPNCHWELEEGVCGSCGLHIGDEDGFGDDTGGSENDSDEESDHSNELDRDFMTADFDGMNDFEEDDFVDEGNPWEQQPDIDIDIFGPDIEAHLAAAARRRRRPRSRHQPINVDSEPESEDSEDPDNDPEMEGFLVDEEPENSGSDSSREEPDSEEEAEETPRHRPRRLVRPTVINSDSDDGARQQQSRMPVVIDSDPDDDEEGPVVRNNRASKISRGSRRQQVHEISSGEDTSEAEDGGDGTLSQNNDDTDGQSDSDDDNGGVNAGTFSPMQPTIAVDSQADAYDDEDEDPYGGFGMHEAGGDSQADGDEDPYGDFGIHDGGDSDEDEGGQEMYCGNDYNDQFDDDDGGRTTRTETTPPNTTAPESAASHRLSKRQKRRRRNADRDSATITNSNDNNINATAAAADGTFLHPPQRHRHPSLPEHDEDSLAEELSEHEQERRQRARMRRIQGRHSLRC